MPAKKQNTYRFKDDYGIAYDSHGNAIYFDIEDYEKVSGCYWFVNSFGYALAWEDGKFIRMHRRLVNCMGDKVVDHINHNKSDNRKKNLRVCENWENQFNQPLQKSNTSGYKGVDFHFCKRKWRARIRVKGERIELGHFPTAEQAFSAYCKASEKYHGEFGCIGTPG